MLALDLNADKDNALPEPTDVKVYFDVRQSLRSRTILRLIIAPLFAIGLIWLGTWLIPDETVFAWDIQAIETWNGWSFVGAILVLHGVFTLVKELIFGLRAYAQQGFWHFRLTDTDLLWHVPDHSFGEEDGFDVPLEDIKQIKFKTIQKYEESNEREYWIHFHSRDPIQLNSYSGISLSWLVKEMQSAGIDYKETYEN